MNKLTQEDVEKIILNKLGNDYVSCSPYINKTTHMDIRHNKCGVIYQTSINNIDCGFGKCPNCRNRARKYTQESFTQKVKNICPDIEVLSPYITSYQKMRFLYVPDDQEFVTTPQEIYKRVGYPFSRHCNGTKPKIGINDMWTTHPKAAKCLVNPDDGYRYPFGTNAILDFECPICHTRFSKSPRNLFRSNDDIKCNCCSDGFSYPEKLMSNILSSLDIDYIYQLTSTNGFTWCGKRRYDFYLPSFNAIIETNGIQHYIQKWKQIPLTDIQRVDTLKREMALANGIEHYIVIDCSHSYLSAIKENILKSELSNLIDLSSVDWDNCDRNAVSSKMRQVCCDFEGGDGVNELCDRYGISRTTVYKYLRRGFENNLITRDVEAYIKSQKVNGAA